jgi:hypothetical protein
MQPSESAVAICKIMAGYGLKADETSARSSVQGAFLGLGSEHTSEEFDDGVAYCARVVDRREPQHANDIAHRVSGRLY